MEEEEEEEAWGDVVTRLSLGPDWPIPGRWEESGASVAGPGGQHRGTVQAQAASGHPGRWTSGSAQIPAGAEGTESWIWFPGRGSGGWGEGGFGGKTLRLG